MTGQPKKDRTTRLPRHRCGLFTERAKRWAFVLAVAMTGAASISVARADEAQAKRLLRAMSDYLAAQKEESARAAKVLGVSSTHKNLRGPLPEKRLFESMFDTLPSATGLAGLLF